MTTEQKPKKKTGWPKGRKRDPRIHAPTNKPDGMLNPKRQEYQHIIVEALDGEHPLAALARMAKESEADGDKTLAVACYKELSNYVAPKLKSVEVKKENDNVKPITIIVDDSASKQIEDHRNRVKPIRNQSDMVGELVNDDDDDD